MIRDWFKDLLKEVFSDDIEQLHHAYIEKKYGDVVEKEILELIAPLREDVTKFQNNLRTQLMDIDKAVTAELKISKKQINDALAKSVESLPKKLEALEVKVDGINEVLNKKVRTTVSSEISRTHDAYNTNYLVRAVKAQFKQYVETHDFIGNFADLPESEQPQRKRRVQK